jgi:hypothetical protein
MPRNAVVVSKQAGIDAELNMVPTDQKTEVVRSAEEPDEVRLPSDPKAIFLGGLFVLALLATAYVASEIVLPLVFAITLKLLLQPALRLLERLHVPRMLAGQGPRLSQPYPRPRDAQSSALAAAGGSQPEEEPSPSSHRACVRSTGNFSRQPPRADDRHRQSASKDRVAEPRLQHPPPRDARTNGRRMREETGPAAP